jgi:hypothetical protein
MAVCAEVAADAPGACVGVVERSLRCNPKNAATGDLQN